MTNQFDPKEFGQHMEPDSQNQDFPKIESSDYKSPYPGGINPYEKFNLSSDTKKNYPGLDIASQVTKGIVKGVADVNILVGQVGTYAIDKVFGTKLYDKVNKAGKALEDAYNASSTGLSTGVGRFIGSSAVLGPALKGVGLAGSSYGKISAQGAIYGATNYSPLGEKLPNMIAGAVLAPAMKGILDLGAFGISKYTQHAANLAKAKAAQQATYSATGVKVPMNASDFNDPGAIRQTIFAIQESLPVFGNFGLRSKQSATLHPVVSQIIQKISASNTTKGVASFSDDVLNAGSKIIKNDIKKIYKTMNDKEDALWNTAIKSGSKNATDATPVVNAVANLNTLPDYMFKEYSPLRKLKGLLSPSTTSLTSEQLSQLKTKVQLHTDDLYNLGQTKPFPKEVTTLVKDLKATIISTLEDSIPDKTLLSTAKGYTIMKNGLFTGAENIKFRNAMKSQVAVGKFVQGLLHDTNLANRKEYFKVLSQPSQAAALAIDLQNGLAKAEQPDGTFAIVPFLQHMKGGTHADYYKGDIWDAMQGYVNILKQSAKAMNPKNAALQTLGKISPASLGAGLATAAYLGGKEAVVAGSIGLGALKFFLNKSPVKSLLISAKLITDKTDSRLVKTILNKLNKYPALMAAQHSNIDNSQPELELPPNMKQ